MVRIYYGCMSCSAHWYKDVRSLGLFGNWAWCIGGCGRKIQPASTEEI
jgi:hypothetical protein